MAEDIDIRRQLCLLLGHLLLKESSFGRQSFFSFISNEVTESSVLSLIEGTGRNYIEIAKAKPDLAMSGRKILENLQRFAAQDDKKRLASLLAEYDVAVSPLEQGRNCRYRRRLLHQQWPTHTAVA